VKVVEYDIYHYLPKSGMIEYQKWLQEEVPFTGGLTREQYYKKYCPKGNPRDLYNLIQNVVNTLPSSPDNN